jgi:hypothetical protein
MQKIILSRGRHNVITTHEILKDPILVVPESEVELYAWTQVPIIPIPDEKRGLAAVRNWILDNIEGDLIMFDDDVTQLVNLTHKGPENYKDKDIIEEVLKNTYECALGAGVHVFGFNQKNDVRKFRSYQPFQLCAWVGCVVGFIGRKHRFDENNKLKVDIDYCLQTLLEERIVWMDERWAFCQKRDNNAGGNSIYRTRERQYAEMDYLKKKWGSYLHISYSKSKESISIAVQRRQGISLNEEK